MCLNDGFHEGLGRRVSLTENRMNRIKHVWEVGKNLTVGTTCPSWKVVFSPHCGSLECQDHPMYSLQVKAHQR